MSKSFDHINNIKLLKNNFEHIFFELSKEQPSFFRISREYHQALIRSMVQALKGTANLAITGRPKDKNRFVYYQWGNDPCKEIHKEKIDVCKKAWRYSKPQICEPPSLNEKAQYKIPPHNNYLIGYYDLLAMIQTFCFMGMDGGKEIILTNDELRALEFLHEEIRNEYEHFVPKSYSSPISDLIYVSIICDEIISQLLIENKYMIISQVPDDLINLIHKNSLLLKFFDELSNKKKND